MILGTLYDRVERDLYVDALFVLLGRESTVGCIENTHIRKSMRV